MTESSSDRELDFAALRIEYMLKSLDERDILSDPISQFVLWLNEAITAEAHEPNAMTLATCTPDGIPSARIVLLKGVDDHGFVFFTNYLSHKGRELTQNPKAALVFYWPELERQVRVEGDATRTTQLESADYFHSRPRDAQIGSAASPQSQPIASRDELAARFEDLRNRYPNGNIPCPSHWGGLRIRPRRIEFWQGRMSRLHDRIEYLRDDQGGWKLRRLAP